MITIFRILTNIDLLSISNAFFLRGNQRVSKEKWRNISDPIETLNLREKGKHLSAIERWQMYKLINVDKVECKLIFEKFKLSYSTVYNITKEFSNKNYIGMRSLSKHANNLLQSKMIQRSINTYLADTTRPYWIEDLIKYVAKVHGVHLQYHQLRNYIKDKLNLSYKKGGNRPWNLDLKRQKPLKELYAIQLINMMKSGKDIINIDESWLNKNTRVSYSWLNKGKNCYLTNTKFENSVSFISAIWTNRFAFNAVCLLLLKTIPLIPTKNVKSFSLVFYLFQK